MLVSVYFKVPAMIAY